MDLLTLIPRNDADNNRQYAYRTIRHNIMTMVLLPGATLNEGNISEQLNISRTPVHEALIQLKSEGLVDIVPQSGSKVTLISLSSVREGLFMRSCLEPAIYRQLAGNIDITYLDSMKENIAQTELFSKKGLTFDLARFLFLDDEFHRLAYIAANKPNLWTARLSVCSHYDRIRYHVSADELEDFEQILNDHTILYEYLLLGDSPSFDLESHYNQHLEHFKACFSTLYANNPEFFAN